MFYSIWIFYVFYRLFEMRVAKSNDVKKNPLDERGISQRKLMMLLHISWFLSMMLEFGINKLTPELSEFKYIFLLLLLFSGYLRFYSMKKLGRHWSTKIYRINPKEVVRDGLYKYFNHPNYLGVAIEIFCVPFLFNLYYTAMIFGFINILFLIFRIKKENRVLMESF